MSGRILSYHRIHISTGNFNARPGKKAAGIWAIKSLAGSLQSPVLGEAPGMAQVYGLYLPSQGRRRGCGGSNQGETAETARICPPARPIATGRSSAAAESVSE